MSLRAYSHNILAQGGSSQDSNLFDATCDSSVVVGDVVRFSAGVLVKAQADSYTNSRIVGFVESKASSTLCTVRVAGPTPANYSGLDVTADYFLSATTAGALSTTVPTSSGQVVLFLGRPLSSTEFVISIGDQFQRA